MSVTIPASFVDLVAGRPPEPAISGDDWLAGLPALIERSLDRFELAVDEGPVRHGVAAIVVPVRRGDTPAVLKLSWPHTEASLEHLALRTWDGRGAVRLLAADPATYALVLERLDGARDLTSVDLLEACEQLGRLFTRLDRPAIPQLQRLSSEAQRWIALCHKGSDAVPRRLTDQAAVQMTELITDPDVDAHLIHQDLHYENALAADREPWLAIDPKPLAGEWAFGVAPAVWNRWEEAQSAYNLRAHLRLRLGIICETAGLAEERALAWTFCRLVLNALWSAEDDDAAAITQWIAAAKAMTG
ncbi:aminoglycoside phosphotransferase family protein [Metallococcus carri]|uniref:aminoglycoside phosphotransferase family protein n=1 Tax=Metallococcus carri TaxID=1656884 RepID=UPI002E2B6ED6|nr:aminoglycoside phosphotransferase family protein [Metallococcus carri]